MKLYSQTPLIESTPLRLILGKSVYLKMESAHATGSFKQRGISHQCEAAVQQGYTHLVAPSGGNAGLAAAYAGRKLNTPVTVVIKTNVTEDVCKRIEAEGATVIKAQDLWKTANEIAKAKSGVIIHPFDHPTVWEGHSAMIDEIRDDMAETQMKPDVVVLAVGGGGLLCGVAKGLHRVGWSKVPIVAVETEGAPTLFKAVEAGHVVELESTNTIATTLAATVVTDEALKWNQRHRIIPVLVSDNDALNACVRFADDHKVLVEPACGAALCLLYNKHEVIEPFATIVVIVCGGCGMSVAQLRKST